jgi:hypothetical protein
MKNISYWAKRHKWASRVLLIVSFLLLTVLGLVTGNLLSEIGIIIPIYFFLLVIGIYILAVLFYPSKTEKLKFSAARFYKKQKTADFILAASTFCMVICISNDQARQTLFFSSVNAMPVNHPTLPADSIAKPYKSLAAFSASLKDENGKLLKWKERKKLLKAQVKAIKQVKEMTNGERIALIILSIAIAVGLLFLVAALACELSCNGAEGAAILLGIGGTVLVLFLLAIVIRSINRKYRTMRMERRE